MTSLAAQRATFSQRAQSEAPQRAQFTAADCQADLSIMAASACPQLAQLWAEMGMETAECVYLMIELREHLEDVFTTTINEAEEMRHKLTGEIHEHMKLIPMLAAELDDQTCVQELAAVDPAVTGLIPRSHAVKAIYNRLVETKTLTTKIIHDSYQELLVLYRELGIEASEQITERDPHDLSYKKVQRLKAEVERMSASRQQIMQKINELAQQALTLCQELDVQPDAFTNQVVQPHFVLSQVRDPADASSSMASFTYASLLSCVQKRFDKLLLRQQQMRTESARLTEAIHKLWARLEMPKTHQQRFLAVQAKQPLSGKSLRACQVELQELEAMKASRMTQLVDNVRVSIVELWNKLGFSQAQQLAFREFYATPAVLEDDFLTLHEVERDRLNEMYQHYKPILALIEKRNAYHQALTDHELSSHNPDRLVTRLPNFLLLKEEERIRNVEKKWLPKVEAQLIERLERWEKENQQLFTFQGERLIDRIKSDEQEKAHNAAAKKKLLDESRGKNAVDRASVYGKKVESGARHVDNTPTTIRSISHTANSSFAATPSRGATASSRAQATPVSSSLNMSASSSLGSARRVLESRIPNHNTPSHDSPLSQTHKSRPTPSHAHLSHIPQRSPRTHAKENVSM